MAEPMTLDTLVEKYIGLRDKRSAITDEAKQKVARIDAVLDKIEGIILKQFNDTGAESVRTASGTAYKSKRVSITPADWDVVLGFIREHDMYHMLERRVSKAAVEAYREEVGGYPPGLNVREEVVVNIRRS